MKLSDFDYELPLDRIAQIPSEPRDSARLLVDCGRSAGSLNVEHRKVHDFRTICEPVTYWLLMTPKSSQADCI